MGLLASAEERHAGLALAQANRQLEQAKTRLQELHDYATSSDEKLHEAGRQTSVNLHNRRLFLGKLQEAIKTQTSVLSQLGRQRADLIEQWRVCYKKTRLYEKLQEQASLKLKNQLRQIDTKSSDEVAAQQHYQKMRD